MSDLLEKLSGGDLRTVGEVSEVVTMVTTEEIFAELFILMFSDDEVVAMRAADAVEKITLKKPSYLFPYKEEIIQLLGLVKIKQIKWHLALLASRPDWTIRELGIVWDQLFKWTENRKESRIVRVNSVQSLHDLSEQHPELKEDFLQLVDRLNKENIPSILARIRRLKL